ncbi:MAG: valine--tRNA ligase [archaeon]
MAFLEEKHWTKDAEEQIYSKWKTSQCYKFDKGSKLPVYSIDTPPPYVNTPVHIGQATTYVLMDMFARYKRMAGHNVLFPLGLDRNGLPIEMAAEKKFKVKLTETPREKFIEYCNKVLEESSLASTESFLRLGISFNSWKKGTKLGEIYETDSEDYRTLTQETFIDLWKKGLIYEDTRINNWCPGCQTTLADAEVDYEELPSFFNDVKFKVKETGEEIVIGTTRPELICSCGMVIFNPEDKRYKHLAGKTAVTPLYNKEVSIKAHTLANPEKGTGLVMMCSAGDLSDIRFFREMNLEPVIAINKDGTMNEHAGFLKGLKVKDAQRAIAQKLKEEGLIVNQKRTTHRTPICERSKDPIEFIAMPELYVKQTDQTKQMKKLAKELNFYDPKSRQILNDWIDTVSIDWPITRNRYYATEVPLWYCKKCNEAILPPKGKYYKPWKENPPVKTCPKCKSKEFKGDERVFDTWFDSSITPLYILKYSRDDKFFKQKVKGQCSLRPQGKEIVRTWLYYTLLKCYLLTGKGIFKDTWINYHIVDETGHKMSKSVGNVIDPKEVLDKFGAEPLRLWTAVEGNLEKTDFKCSYERIEGAGKTITKLWNIAKFVKGFPKPGTKIKLNDLDNWIINEMNSMTKLAKERYEAYDFHNPAIALRNFIWETFASHYIELVKNRAYNPEGKFKKEEQDAALHTLNYCLDTLLKLLAPITPMITHAIYQDLFSKDIHLEKFPKEEKTSTTKLLKEELAELNSKIWKTKKDAGQSLKAEVSEITIPKKFKTIEPDLIAAHNIKKIGYGAFKIKL